MKAIRNLVFVGMLVVGTGGCGVNSIPTTLVTVAEWVTNLFPLAEDVVELVKNVVNGDVDPAVKAEVDTAVAKLEAAKDRVIASKGKGLLAESAKGLEAFAVAYRELVAVLERNQLGVGLGPDETILAAAPGKLVIPTFEALKEKAGVE